MASPLDVDVISLDLGGTLLDVQESVQAAWHTILGDGCSKSLSDDMWRRATTILRTELHEAGSGRQPFRSVRTIFKDSFRILFAQTGLTFDPNRAAELWVKGHEEAGLYPDALSFLQTAGRAYRLCLTSECDLELLNTIRRFYSFDHEFISQQLLTYKSNPVFYERILQHYRLRPEKVLHVGDADVDVTVPAKIGIRTCWVNRGGRRWDDETKPDLEIRSLTQLADLLASQA